jgi:ligand-binding sensor domain-containing protein/two-component sensor histidine kinase
MFYQAVIKKAFSFFAHPACIAISILTNVSNSTAQENTPRLRFELINADHGLSVGTMTGMLKDRRGFLWFISSNGINRFDGYEFKVFRSDPADHTTISPGMAINCAEDQKGNIWIACDIPWGLNSYNPNTGKFTRYNEDPFYKKHFPERRVWRILFDKKNVLWMCVEGQGVFSWDQETNAVRHYKHDPNDPFSLADNNTWDCDMDSSGNIYFCTPDNIDMLNVRTGKFRHFPLNLKIKRRADNTWDLQIEIDSKNNLWVTTPEGLKKMDPLTGQLTAFVHSDSFNSISGDKISAVKETPDGKIWINTSTGLNVYDPRANKFSLYKSSASDPYSISNFQWGLCYDNSGVMWIPGTTSLNKVNLIPVKFHSEWNWPNSIFQDRDGKILVADHYTVYVFDPVRRKFTPFLPDNTAKKLLTGRNFQSIFQDRDGVYWFGVDFKHLVSYDPNTKNWRTYQFKHDHHKDSLGVVDILSPVYQDRQGKIWFGGVSGACNYDPTTKKFKSFLVDPKKGSLPINNVYSVFDPGDGRVWFGSEGLSYYDAQKDAIIPARFDQNEAARILSRSRISCTYKAGDHVMWIGTQGSGLFLLDFKTGECRRITTKHGLSSDMVFGIMKDKQGNLWITTGDGLSKYTPPGEQFDEKNNGVFRIYNRNDGLPAKPCRMTHPLTSNDGTMYFVVDGGYNGLVFFNPDSLEDNPFRPPVFVTDFKLFNKSVLPGDSTAVLRSTIESTKEIILSYKQNVISFTFSALSFVHPENNKYAYKLDGFDKEWIFTDASKRFANYTNLDPGEYTFLVKASNNDGVWNETPTSIYLVIKPPFWQTWWFRSLVVMILVALAYGIYRYRLSQLIRLQNIRNKISSDLHDDIGSTLNSISVYSEVAIQEPSKHEHALRMIGESSRKIIDSMSDIVWTINPGNDSFEEIILRMRSLAFNLLRTKNIEFTFRAAEELNELRLSMEDRRNLFLIFKECINNLVKYAEATSVNIQLEYTDKKIRLLISDNGKGFDATQPSNGNGLKSMKRRAKEMKASLKIESVTGSGTSIELIMKP